MIAQDCPFLPAGRAGFIGNRGAHIAMSLEVCRTLQLKVLSKGPVLAAVQMNTGVHATLHVSKEWLHQLEPECELVVANYQLGRSNDEIHIHVDTNAKGMCFLQAHEKRALCYRGTFRRDFGLGKCSSFHEP